MGVPVLKMTASPVGDADVDTYDPSCPFRKGLVAVALGRARKDITILVMALYSYWPI